MLDSLLFSFGKAVQRTRSRAARNYIKDPATECASGRRHERVEQHPARMCNRKHQHQRIRTAGQRHKGRVEQGDYKKAKCAECDQVCGKTTECFSDGRQKGFQSVVPSESVYSAAGPLRRLTRM